MTAADTDTRALLDLAETELELARSYEERGETGKLNGILNENQKTVIQLEDAWTRPRGVPEALQQEEPGPRMRRLVRKMTELDHLIARITAAGGHPGNALNQRMIVWQEIQKMAGVI